MAQSLNDPKAFFDACRSSVMGPKLDQREVSGTNDVIGGLDGLPVSWAAYALATAWHETAHTMHPVREAYWLSASAAKRYFMRMYDPSGKRPKLARANGNVRVGDGPKFCGRGYVQLTWANNYKKAGKRIGVDLYDHPELALDPNNAALIMRYGMVEGWFTGRAFKTYLPSSGMAKRSAFYQARRIINGLDKASLIAGYAIEFQAALVKGKWG
ncbi:glycoside hydrolase family 19 protein [uncultured Erythrobacter sp.]|uniref:glycoside hydrolase family 19 protein n=1 Tax=uncultured Erythrobacter sp. TaxID=263913 RepID=UPI00260FD751|nr:glycoside hydrolase family 19 protein [uncultured Erythrobacter sp.]